MSEKNTIHFIVPVTVPEGFSHDLTGYLSNFIGTGLSDLHNTVNDPDIETDELDNIIVTQVEWGAPFIEVKY